MFNIFRRREASVALDSGEPVGVTVDAVIDSVRPAQGRAGFEVAYRTDRRSYTALLPCNPLPSGGDLVRAGRLLRLQVANEGCLILSVSEVSARRGLFA